MKFVFLRDRVISSTMGHAIEFKKGEATEVPPEMYREVMAAGGVPEEEVDLAPKPATQVDEPVDPISRQKAVFGAFEQLVLSGKREDFTAGGAPHAKALERILGWKLDGKERDQMWVDFQNKDSE